MELFPYLRGDVLSTSIEEEALVSPCSLMGAIIVCIAARGHWPDRYAKRTTTPPSIKKWR